MRDDGVPFVESDRHHRRPGALRHVADQVRGRPLAAKAIAFSSEVDTGSREENASKQKIRASVLIQSEPKRL
jgi:hypothetical protein